MRSRPNRQPAPSSGRGAGSYWRATTSQTTPRAKSPTTRCYRAAYPTPRERPNIWDLTTMNLKSYRAVTVALSSRLSFAFGWLVKNGELAMWLARNAHGHEWG